VTNNSGGNVTLTSVTVTDNGGPSLTGGASSLAQTASTTFTGSTSAVDGVHTDTATASGTGGGVTVTDSDSANYQGVTAAITIDKVIHHGTVTFDSDSGPDLPKVLVGNTVDFNAIVTNTTDGALSLTGVGVSDAGTGAPTLSGGATSLLQNISTTFSGTVSAVDGVHTDTAT